MDFKNIAEKIIELKNSDLILRTQLLQKGQINEGYNEEMKDLHNKNAKDLNDIIDAIGYPTIDEYEYELSMDVLGRMIKTTRQARNLTQEQLGELVGVQKSQISKLENSSNSATIDTILKVFKALNAEIHFNVKLEKQIIKLV